MDESTMRGRVARLAQDLAAGQAPWYEIRSAAGPGASGDEAEILIYESIGGWWGIDAADFAEELRLLTAKTIRLRINSPGGSVFAALAISSALRHHPATVVAYVDSLAASAASVIAVAANEVVMMPGSQMMIHDASSAVYGNADDFREIADFLDQQSDNIADQYAAKAGGTREHWRELMRAETWLFADEAVELGLADRVHELRTAPREELLERTHDLTRFRYAGRAAAPGPRATRTAAAVQVRERPTAPPAPALDIAAAGQARAAAHAAGTLLAVPAGAARCLSTAVIPRTASLAFGPAGELPRRIRASLTERDGKKFHLLEGYFTVYERGYEMWDEHGPYIEIVSRGAGADLDEPGLDVNYLVNHAGLSLARTINGTLELGQDETGGWNKAWLNPERGDVKDLVLSIDDGTVTEQSFAFVIDAGRWSKDFTQFRIDRYLINRGDTSAVNYGANPYTSIATRSLELLRRLDELPAGIARELARRLAGNLAQGQAPASPPAASTVDVRMLEIEAFLAQAEAAAR